jgi:hypothetical protein
MQGLKDTFNVIREAVKGWKTYGVSALAILTGVITYIHSSQSLSTALTGVPGLLVYLGTLGSTIHAAIARIETIVNKYDTLLPPSIQKDVTSIEKKI